MRDPRAVKRTGCAVAHRVGSYNINVRVSARGALRHLRRRHPQQAASRQCPAFV